MAVAYASHDGATLPSLGSTSLVLPKPSGTVAGDLLLVFIVISANTTITPPSGWTQPVNAAGVKGFWKVAGSSEPADYTFTRGLATNTIAGQIVRITGADTTDPYDTAAALAGGTSATTTIPSVTVVDGTFLFQQVITLANCTFTEPGTTTEDFDYQPATQAFGVAGGHETVSAGATGTRTWTASASGPRSGMMWSIIAIPVVDITPADSAHGHTSESPSLTQVHGLAPVDSGHAHAAESPTLTQVHELAPADSAHGHATENPALTQVHALAPADSAHGHGVETPALTQLHQLTPADSDHGHASESSTLTQVYSIAPAGTSHAHASELATLSQVHALVALDSLHTHTSDNTGFSIGLIVTPTSRTSVAAADSRVSAATTSSRTSTASTSSRTSSN